MFENALRQVRSRQNTDTFAGIAIADAFRASLLQTGRGNLSLQVFAQGGVVSCTLSPIRMADLSDIVLSKLSISDLIHHEDADSKLWHGCGHAG